MVKIMENHIKHGMIGGYHYFRKHPSHHLRMDNFNQPNAFCLVSSQSAYDRQNIRRSHEFNVDPKPGALMMKKTHKTKECLKFASKTCADIDYILYLFIIFKYVYGSQLHI